MSLEIFISSLIETIPSDNIPYEIDLVLDGGAFNGCYMLGSLFYLKHLESQGKLTVKRISGCSIGAALGLVYMINKLDIAINILRRGFKYLRKYQNIKHLVELIKRNFYDIVDEDDLSIINGRYYLTYFDTIKGTQVVKRHYSSRQDLLDCVLKSAYVPYMIDKNMTDHDGCVDGAFPYMFKRREGDRKILFINLQSMDKIKNMFYIKNEKSIYPRIFEGLMDTHSFISTKNPTSMCSYVNDWSFIDIVMFRLREYIYTVLIYILRLGLQVDYILPSAWKHEPFVKKNMAVIKHLWRDVILYISI
jgi:predicted acylesterase/phospholipase RssA